MLIEPTLAVAPKSNGNVQNKQKSYGKLLLEDSESDTVEMKNNVFTQ